MIIFFLCSITLSVLYYNTTRNLLGEAFEVTITGVESSSYYLYLIRRRVPNKTIWKNIERDISKYRIRRVWYESITLAQLYGVIMVVTRFCGLFSSEKPA